MMWQLSMLAAIFVVVATILSQCCAGSTVNKNDEAVERNLFAADIFKAVALDKLNDNVVISPAAMQSSLALAYYGAKGKTASEMQLGLRLGSGNAEAIARRFGEFQQTFARDNNLRLANQIYINENLEFKDNFKKFAERNFETSVEKADFHPPYNKRTADRINKAIEAKTNNKLGIVVKPEQLNDLTEGVIANGIVFTAPWQKAFRADKTKKRSFTTGSRQSYDVDTMWTLNNFKYGDIRSLDAKVVELPYQNTDFAMLILLPHKKDGLRNLEQSLSAKNLLALVENEMSVEKVEVFLPKFSVSFGIDLEGPLKQLGVSTMFTRDGDFGNLYRMFVSHYIKSANYKAYVEVAEAGTEQPLESGGLKSLFSSTKKFDADHPFVFAIRHKESVIFMGHIANYVYV